MGLYFGTEVRSDLYVYFVDWFVGDLGLRVFGVMLHCSRKFLTAFTIFTLVSCRWWGRLKVFSLSLRMTLILLVPLSIICAPSALKRCSIFHQSILRSIGVLKRCLRVS